MEKSRESGVVESVKASENPSEKLLLKVLIVVLVFPVLVEVTHFLLMFPLTFVGYLLVHLGGNLEFWSKASSIAALFPAGWGAYVLCKRMWPHSKEPDGSAARNVPDSSRLLPARELVRPQAGDNLAQQSGRVVCTFAASSVVQ